MRAGQRCDRTQQRQGVFLKRCALKLELIGAALAEAFQVGPQFQAELGKPSQAAHEVGGVLLPQDAQQIVVGRCQPGHLDDPARRLGADHAAAAAQQGLVHGTGRVQPPALAQSAQDPREDHREEVVDQRGVPAGQQALLEIPEGGDQLIRGGAGEARAAGRQGIL